MKGKCLLSLSLIAVGLVGCNGQSPSTPQTKETAVAAGEVGSRLPDFSVKDLRGHEISSTELRGKVLLIDFWATWCQPCKKEMPGYQKLADRYGSSGFAVVGFKFDTMMDTEDPLQFAKKIGVYYPLAVATDDLKEKLCTFGVGELCQQTSIVLFGRRQCELHALRAHFRMEPSDIGNREAQLDSPCWILLRRWMQRERRFPSHEFAPAGRLELQLKPKNVAVELHRSAHVTDVMNSIVFFFDAYTRKGLR